MRQEEKVMNLEELKVVDADVAAAIEAEMDRQNSHIELIASENLDLQLPFPPADLA